MKTFNFGDIVKIDEYYSDQAVVDAWRFHLGGLDNLGIVFCFANNSTAYYSVYLQRPLPGALPIGGHAKEWHWASVYKDLLKLVTPHT